MRIQLKKKEIKKEMRIQTDEIKKLNKKYNVHIFSSHVYKGKAFAAEKKIKELKTFFSKQRVWTRGLEEKLDLAKLSKQPQVI